MRLRIRFYDLLLSIYLYNEFIGYQQLERLIAVVKDQLTDEIELINAIEKHRDDEKKHYRMFKNYFIRNQRMPFILKPSNGYISQLIKKTMGKTLDEFNLTLPVESNYLVQLFRLIILTESRGLKQVKSLLRNRLIKQHTMINQIFKTIEVDEPSHFLPYQKFLTNKKVTLYNRKEIFSDYWVHYCIVLLKFPTLYINPFLNRSQQFYDELHQEQADTV